MSGYQSKREMAADKLRDCVHGSLARSCQICDLAAEVEELKAALAQPAQEPVAWITPDGEGFRIRFSPPTNDVPLGWDALYTTPPQREWVGLTDDKRGDIAINSNCSFFLRDYPNAMFRFAQAIEQSLKENNT